jgi:hypothetical protein
MYKGYCRYHFLKGVNPGSGWKRQPKRGKQARSPFVFSDIIQYTNYKNIKIIAMPDCLQLLFNPMFSVPYFYERIIGLKMTANEKKPINYLKR